MEVVFHAIICIITVYLKACNANFRVGYGVNCCTKSLHGQFACNMTWTLYQLVSRIGHKLDNEWKMCGQTDTQLHTNKQLSQQTVWTEYCTSLKKVRNWEKISTDVQTWHDMNTHKTNTMQERLHVDRRIMKSHWIDIRQCTKVCYILNNDVRIAPVQEDIIRCLVVMCSMSVNWGIVTVSVGMSLTAATFIVLQYCSNEYHRPSTTPHLHTHGTGPPFIESVERVCPLYADCVVISALVYRVTTHYFWAVES